MIKYIDWKLCLSAAKVPDVRICRQETYGTEVFDLSSFVCFENVCKIYKTGSVEVKALTDASFEIEKGEICVIVGQSGAGKTTLLNILGGMDTLTSGKVLLDGRDISSFNKRQLAEYRRNDI